MELSLVPFNKNHLFWNKNHTNDITRHPSSYFLKIFEESPPNSSVKLSEIIYLMISYEAFSWSQ